MILRIVKSVLAIAFLFWLNGFVSAQDMENETEGQGHANMQQPQMAAPATQTPGAPGDETAPGAGEPAATASSAPAVTPVMEIKPVEGQEGIYSFELRDAEVGDLFRVLAHDYKLNLLIDKEVTGKMTASLSNVSLEEALEAIAEAQGLVMEKKGNIVKVGLNLVTKVFPLKYVEAKKILEPSTESTTDSSTASGSTSTSSSSSSTSSMESAEGSGATGESSASGQENTIYDLLSEKGKVLLGKSPNSIMVIDYPQYVKKVEDYLQMMDHKMSQRVFRLRFMKAADVVGEGTSASSTSTSETTSTEGSTTESSSSSSASSEM